MAATAPKSAFSSALHDNIAQTLVGKKTAKSIIPVVRGFPCDHTLIPEGVPNKSQLQRSGCRRWTSVMSCPLTKRSPRAVLQFLWHPNWAGRALRAFLFGSCWLWRTQESYFHPALDLCNGTCLHIALFTLQSRGRNRRFSEGVCLSYFMYLLQDGMMIHALAVAISIQWLSCCLLLLRGLCLWDTWMSGQTESPAVPGRSCLKSQAMGKNKENQKQGVLFNMNPAGQPDLNGCDPQEQPLAAANETPWDNKGKHLCATVLAWRKRH